MKVIIHGNREDVVSAIRRRMTEILEGKGLENVVNFEVEVEDKIPIDSRTGKFKLIIPYDG